MIVDGYVIGVSLHGYWNVKRWFRNGLKFLAIYMSGYETNWWISSLRYKCMSIGIHCQYLVGLEGNCRRKKLIESWYLSLISNEGTNALVTGLSKFNQWICNSYPKKRKYYRSTGLLWNWKEKLFHFYKSGNRKSVWKKFFSFSSIVELQVHSHGAATVPLSIGFHCHTSTCGRGCSSGAPTK